MLTRIIAACARNNRAPADDWTDARDRRRDAPLTPVARRRGATIFARGRRGKAGGPRGYGGGPESSASAVKPAARGAICRTTCRTIAKENELVAV